MSPTAAMLILNYSSRGNNRKHQQQEQHRSSNLGAVADQQSSSTLKGGVNFPAKLKLVTAGLFSVHGNRSINATQRDVLMEHGQGSSSISTDDEDSMTGSCSSKGAFR